MAQTNTTSTLSGLFKEVYGDSPQRLIPESSLILKMVPFKEAERIGNKYHQPVVLSGEQGVTVVAAGSGLTALNSSIAAAMQDAQIQGSAYYIRGQLTYDAAAKASQSKAAFARATDLMVENLVESLTKRLEIACLYGQKGLGVADTSANASATSTVVTLTAASFSAAIWGGMEGAELNFYKTSDDSLISSGADAIFTISSVDVDNKTLTLTGTATGITALDTHLGSGDANIYFRGAKTAEFAGLDKIITNTTSLFNIDAASYNLWKGSSYSVGGAISMSAVLAAVAKAVNRGLNEKVVVFLNPIKWNVLNADQAALRRYNDGGKEASNGFQSIKYFGPNGEIEVIAHPFVKEGEGFVVPMKRVKRIGATDVTFNLPGKGDEMFLHVPDYNGYEMRAMADQAIFVETPARSVKLTGIS